MKLLKCCVVLAAAALAACATTPQPSADAAGAASELDPNDLLVLNASADNPGSVVTCRDVLKTGSNVLVTRCMTRDGWKAWRRLEERQAQQMLRAMQGSGYLY